VKHFYRATVPYEVSDRDWEALSPALRRRLVEPILAAIVDDVAHAAETQALDAGGVHVTRTPLALDDRGWDELSRLLETVVGDALRIQDESSERLQGRAAPTSSALAILHCQRD
jgi:hypothetical protein